MANNLTWVNDVIIINNLKNLLNLFGENMSLTCFIDCGFNVLNYIKIYNMSLLNSIGSLIYFFFITLHKYTGTFILFTAFCNTQSCIIFIDNNFVNFDLEDDIPDYSGLGDGTDRDPVGALKESWDVFWNGEGGHDFQQSLDDDGNESDDDEDEDDSDNNPNGKKSEESSINPYSTIIQIISYENPFFSNDDVDPEWSYLTTMAIITSIITTIGVFYPVLLEPVIVASMFDNVIQFLIDQNPDYLPEPEEEVEEVPFDPENPDHYWLPQLWKWIKEEYARQNPPLPDPGPEDPWAYVENEPEVPFDPENPDHYWLPQLWKRITTGKWNNIKHW